MVSRKDRLIARFKRDSTLLLLKEMKAMYERAEWSSILAVQCLEKSVCERLDVEYSFRKHNVIFTAFYLGEIDGLTVLEGIIE